METVERSTWGRQLVYKLTCPHCWNTFFPEDVMFIARHPELIGDEVAGSNEYKRFSPTRFTVKGDAVDPRGLPTFSLACPRCHLQVPQAMLETPPLFLSVIGSPASGKSYFLTAMSWELRHMLPKALLSFSDADPTGNSPIHEYEQTLFLNPKSDDLTEIRKTQTDDPRLYRTTSVDGVTIRFPIPLQFALTPMREHPKFPYASKIRRIVVMYDNAGEDYLPKEEDASSAVTQHLAMSRILLMFFDPTQDPRFRSRLQTDDPQLSHEARPGAKQQTVLLRQETLLQQAAVRIRRHLGLSQDKAINKPLVIVVSKADVLASLVDLPLGSEPYAQADPDKPILVRSDLIDQVSDRIRRLFLDMCPEFVATAEGLSNAVRYIPVSSLGCSPEYTVRGETGFYGVRPRNVKPRWVTVPLLYCLSQWAPGLIGVQNEPR